MKESLLVIDMTNDFVDDKGSLTLGKAAQDICPYILDLCKKFKSEEKPIFLVNDYHFPDDPQFTLGHWPKHCIAGTKGQELYTPLKEWVESSGKSLFAGDQFECDGETYYDNVAILPKSAYDAFMDTDLIDELLYHEIGKIHLVGVCTDICVFATALSAYANGFEIAVHDRGCATFTPNHKLFLEHMKLCCKAEIVQ